MNRATWTLLAAVVLFGAAILAFVLTSGGSTRVVRTQTTVVEAPPLTPLPRDSGPKNNPRGHASGQVGASGSSTSSEAPKSEPTPANRPSTPATAPKPATTHKRPAAPPKPNTGGQAPQPAPTPPQPPPAAVGVTAPAPATVCLRPAATVNCP
jgi:cytoskeletal protein RodZ